jgi:nitroreductase
MDVFEALYTTRAMRRVKPDPIPEDIQKSILDAAIRAPSGGNSQNWRFLLIDDADLKAKLGPLYRECMETLWGTFYKDRVDAMNADPDDPENVQWRRVYNSANWLAENFETYPLLMLAFSQHDPSGGSIFPAVWNAMLAARAHGIGSSLTSAFLLKWPDVAAALEVPEDEGWNFAGCVTMGYPTGRWGVAPRTPAHEVAFRNSWDGALGFEIPEPLWPAR